MSKTTILIVDDKIENLVNFINKSAVNTFNLLEDLLLWARAQSGKLIFNPQELELSVIWSKVEGILEPIAKQKNITVLVHHIIYHLAEELEKILQSKKVHAEVAALK